MTIEWINYVLEREIERVLDSGEFYLNKNGTHLTYEWSRQYHNEDVYLGRDDAYLDLKIKYRGAREPQVLVFYEFTTGGDTSMNYIYHVDYEELKNPKLIHKIVQTIESRQRLY